MICLGDGDDHCCWLGENGRCQYLAETHPVTGRRWVCSLRAELGDWATVHNDDRYVANVRPKLDAIGVDVDCGDWPTPGERCATCGSVG